MGLENRVVYNFIDVIEKVCKLNQAIVKDKRVPGLYLLPAAQTRTKDAVNPEQMIALCEELKQEFDFVLLDCLKNAAAGADEALVVTTPEIPSVRDADRIIGMLESMGKSPIRLIINRLRPNMVQDGDMLAKDDILDVLSIDLIGVVPEDENVIRSTNSGEPMTISLESPAAQAYLNIAERLLGHDVPLMDLESYATRGFISKIKKFFSGKRKR